MENVSTVGPLGCDFTTISEWEFATRNEGQK